MLKLTVLASLLWLLLFILRVNQIGGIDPTFSDSEAEVLKPLRNYLASRLDQIMPYPQSALLSGMILGTGKHLPFQLKQKLKTTSTIHLVVISGQNLSMVAGFVMVLTTFLGRGKVAILTVAVITFYSVLTGLAVPVLRATIMTTLALLGQILGKENIGWLILVFTAGLMLLYQPNWLLSLSFQLSFLATLGVVVVAPILLDSLKAIPRIFREDLAVTMAAQALTLPVIAYNFSSISLVGILVNSLILWTIPLVMIWGFVALGVSLISQLIGQIVGLIPTIFLTYFLDVVEIFAKFDFSSIYIGETVWFLWLGYYLLIVAVIWLIKVKVKTSSH